MATQQDYQNLIAKIEKIVGDANLYIADECVDRENALEGSEWADGSPEFWDAMIRSAAFAALCRAEDQNVSPAKLKRLGKFC